jgi:hypothetical protein
MHSPLLADLGLPMIFVEWPLMLCALLPVIGLEGLVIHRSLSLSYRAAFLGVGKANIYSTLVGVPMAWGIMFLFQLATSLVMIPLALAQQKWHWTVLNAPIFQAVGFLLSLAWELPLKGQLYWIVPTAATLLLIPCFFVSVRLERRSCLCSWPSVDPAAVWRSVFLANLWSYGFLFLVACAWVLYHLRHPGLE